LGSLDRECHGGQDALEGNVKGDVAEAIFTWRRTGSDPQEWTFKGKLKKT
jgi:hypothetical protein